jgi:hypothetical protein
MEVLELRKREVWDHFRVSTRVRSIVVIREQLALDRLVVDRVWLRVHTLHFVEHNSLEHHISILLVKFEMPALLLEDFGVFEAAGVEYSIEIHVTEIVEVLQSLTHAHVAFVARFRVH